MADTITTASATAKFVRVSPMKARRVLALVRGKDVAKVVASAAANAENNFGLDPRTLVISECYANEGPTMRRYQPRAQGRAFQIRKRTSHITVVVESKEGAK